MQVSRIDHVHLEVADRLVAAAWYELVLGLKRHSALESWANDPMGPLILEGGDGYPALSLFARDAKGASRDTTIAFRVSGEEFLAFSNDIERLNLKNEAGKIVTKADIVDHELSWSIYFLDPDENRLEVTTYDYGIVANGI
jgi:catechol 2,3-dioxygenase-like lactoylglutathione lyase family enzyme